MQIACGCSLAAALCGSHSSYPQDDSHATTHQASHLYATRPAARSRIHEFAPAQVSHLYVFSDFIVDHYSQIGLAEALRAYPCALLLHPNRSSGAADVEHRPGGAKHNLFAKGAHTVL